MPLIQEFLEKSNVQCKPLPPAANERGVEVYKLRIGGKDAQKEKFKGWVEVEKFTWNGVQGSFCLMKKDEGGCVFRACDLCAHPFSFRSRAISYLGSGCGRFLCNQISSTLMSCASETARGGNGSPQWNRHDLSTFQHSSCLSTPMLTVK